MAGHGPTWWRPDRLAARRGKLAARGLILDAVRQFFADEGFIEVQTPALQVSPGLEPHLKAFRTALNDPRDGGVRPRYLHTSPEFAMKKLLAGGMEKIWQLAPVFRDGERGATHHPEFAMLEWYRAGATYRDLMADCEALLGQAQAAASVTSNRHSREIPGSSPGRNPGQTQRRPLLDPRLRGGDDGKGRETGMLMWQGKTADARLPFQRLSVAEAFATYAGIDILATAPDPAHPDIALLTAASERVGIVAHPGDDWEALYFRIFLDRIEPHLGIGAPTVLYDYPVSMAALSRRKPGDPRLAERFELYACGLELANAFQELTDPEEQRARFLADQARKQALYGETYPIDEDFLAALEYGLPDCAGIALGFDRLVMLCTGAEHIEDVLWASVD
jgi:lysyl-tRNA synthetase class 2